MAAQTPNTQQTTSVKDQVYDASIHSLAKFKPFTSDNAKKNKKIAFLLHFPLSEEKTRSTVDVIRSEWGCEECGKRVRKMFFFVDADGKGILEPDADDVILTSEQEKMVTEVKKFVHECKRENPKVEDEKWKLEVVASTDAWRNVLEGLKEEDGQLERKKIQATMNLQTKDKGGYEHYYMNPSDVTSQGVDLLLMNKAFHKYQRLMSKLFEKFNSEEEWTGMVDSLEMMLKILNGATYGSKFVGSTTWFLECFKRSSKPFYWMSVIERADFIGKAICTAPIGEELGNQAAIPFYHQVNDNIMGLLGVAQSEESMRRLVEMRLNPNYYQQKTAAPKAGAVAMAADALGQFSVSIATIRELETDPRFSATIKVGKDSDSTPEQASDIYAGLRTKGKTSSKTKGAAGFASRAGGKKDELPSFVRTTYDGKYTLTVCELMQHVKNGDIKTVEVFYCNEHTDSMVTSTTLSKDKLIHPHMWLFLNDQDPRFLTNTIIRVTHLVPIQTQTHTNCMFVLEGGREAVCRRPYNPNACLGEFLNSKYHACKSTFMEVGRKIGTKVPTPSDGELAFGIGVSKATTYNSRLHKSVIIYINGNRNKPITVANWI
jgi:hypothetical protein